MGLKLEILEDYASLHLKMWTPLTAAGFPFCRTSRAYSPQEDSIKMSDANEKNRPSVRIGGQRVRGRVIWNDDVDETLTKDFGDTERPLTAVQYATADGTISIRITGIDLQAIKEDDYARQGRITVRTYGTEEVFEALEQSAGNPVLICVECWREDSQTREFHLTKVTPVRGDPSESSEE